MIRGFVYGTRAGVGGLGLQAATAVAGLAARGPVVALGPGYARDWPLETPGPQWCGKSPHPSARPGSPARSSAGSELGD